VKAGREAGSRVPITKPLGTVGPPRCDVRWTRALCKFH